MRMRRHHSRFVPKNSGEQNKGTKGITLNDDEIMEQLEFLTLNNIIPDLDCSIRKEMDAKY